MSEFMSYAEQSLNDYFNIQPSEVKGRDNIGTAFYKRLLWTKLYSVFKFELPEGWKINYFRYFLFHYGSLAVIYTKEFGWICQPYSILERDIYYQPSKIQVYNRFIKNAKVGLIGINSGIINLMDDYFGLDSLITRYAEELAQVEKSININLMNCNTTMLFEAESKKQAEEVKEAYGRATTGEPLVVINKEVMDGKSISTMLGNVGNNYIVDKLLDARRGIINAFLTEIGIKNANMDKRERLNSQEVESNNDETKAIITVIFENLKKAMTEINKISGLDLDVSLRYDYMEGGAGDEQTDSMGD